MKTSIEKEGNLVNLECSHYVHNHEYKKISENMKMFIDNINYYEDVY